MQKKEPIYLIDGSAYIYRAYHAIAPLTNSSGLPTHAVFGFTNILLKVIRDKNPRYLAIAFDVRGLNFRHELFPDYKANRPTMPEDLQVQIPYIREIADGYRIPSLERQGFEADDLIAAAVRTLSATGHPIVLVSGDKDLLQLVSDTVTFWDPMNDRLMNPDAIKKKYNVTPAQLTDLFTLIGDTSDNVPGVPGVGPKTAEKLINQFGSLDSLYDRIHEIDKEKLREKLLENKAQAMLSRELIRLDDKAPAPTTLEEYSLPQPDEAKLRELFTRLEFFRLIKSELTVQSLSTVGFVLIKDEAMFAALLEELKRASTLVLDTETTSLDTLSADLVGISLCTAPERAYYIPVGHKTEDGSLVPGQLLKTEVLARLRPILEDKKIPKLAHNLKYDFAVLHEHGITLKGELLDTMIASYLLDPSRRSHKLDDLAEQFLDRRLTSFEEVTKKDKRPDSFAFVGLETARDYSCEDSRATLLLWEHFKPELVRQDLWSLFLDVEMALVPLLAEMERLGIIVDPAVLDELSKEFHSDIDQLEQQIHRLAGQEFNIGSPKQLGEILFEKLGLPHGRKTKTGYSTDIKVLEELQRYHDLPAMIIAYRNLSKLTSTYVDSLSGQIHPKTGRIHTSFNQTVTATGRLSSSNPNLQNIPIRTREGQRIREAFIPAADHLFLAADYSQIDLRVLAHYAQDQALLKAFRSGRDIHVETAAEIFRTHPGMITSEMRRVAKTINFGIVYGMSAFGLSSQLNLSRKEAQTFIDRYFDHYSGVKQFMHDIVEQARKNGYVTTLLNRKRLLPDINSTNRVQREFAERTAINTPIQGTAADIIKLATIQVDRKIKEAGLAAKLLLQIHDELVFEVPLDQIDKTTPVIKQAMETVLALDVPLIVNASTGANLAET